MLFINHLDPELFKSSRETFFAIDSDYSGLISVNELHDVLKSFGPDEEEAKSILDKVDYDKNGEINYSEFLSGTLTKEHLSKDNIQKLFKFLDTEKQGLLTKQSLAKTFARGGREVSEDEVAKMFLENELNPEEGIDHHKFEELILNDANKQQ